MLDNVTISGERIFKGNETCKGNWQANEAGRLDISEHLVQYFSAGPWNCSHNAALPGRCGAGGH